MDHSKSGGPTKMQYGNGIYAVIGQIGHVPHHLGSLLGGNKLTILCAFVCKVGSFDAQIRKIALYK